MRTLIAAFLLATTAFGQHAPDPRQCKADYDLWHAQVSADFDRLPIGELEDRQFEMWNCAPVRAANDDYPRVDRDYFFMYGAYRVHIGKRFESYVKRHGELKQLIDEDNAGIR